jgi:predicted SPOUT superfamily RNA methylase MTH1
MRPELQYVGILPPLRTPHHTTKEKVKETKIGEYREGIIASSDKTLYSVNVGLDKLMKVQGKSPKIGTRITVKITENKNELTGRRIKKKEIPVYWGYDLRGHRRKLSELVLSKEWELTIATSRTGNNFSTMKSKIEKSWIKSKNTLLVFGSFKEGVKDIIEREGAKIDVFDYNLNMIPNQGTKTVRTEEAVQATLAVLNILGE